MSDRKSSLGTIVKINMTLLAAVTCAFIAWAVWPARLEWWGFGLMSIIIGLAAPANLARAITLMVQLYHRDKAIAAFEATNKKSDPSKLVSDEALRKAGMIK